MNNLNLGILVLGYNRPDSLLKTVSSLRAIANLYNAAIYVYVDGAATNSRRLIEQNVAVKEKVLGLHRNNVIDSYVFRKINLGTMDSVVSAVSDVLSKHEKILVFEDDLELVQNVSVPLEWLFDCLGGKLSAFSLYANKSYVECPFLSRRFSSQGWGTKREFWEGFEPKKLRKDTFIKFKTNELRRELGADMPQAWRKFRQGQVDSWAIPWNIFNFINERSMIYPHLSYVKNNSHLPGAQRTAGIEFDYQIAKSSLKMIDRDELKINYHYLQHYSWNARLKRRLKKFFFKLL